ncbi:phage tail protein I [Paenibacillus selenitireducens]|uniref:Phage tail protein I n=1 Tax=Paenibacillus selenitireducens TaxID=1324314 RepID=A0A1T2XA97_9BACL|nr:phage tail protein I [Paenibacillus selenitireducens]OPA76732.1 phage tail protein I [Paenibacillus selenitireducens]
MININEISLLDLIPPNLLQDPKVVAAAKAIDSEMQQITDEINKLPRYSRMDELTTEEVDEMAWELHIDFYDPKLPLQQCRELVKNAIPWHRRKGTPSAVEELISTVFGGGKVEEWYEYGGKPYYFRVLTDDPEATAAKAQEFIRAIDTVKNLRSRLEKVIITQTTDLPTIFAGVLHMGEYMYVRQEG